jgi:hypothetical protein
LPLLYQIIQALIRENVPFLTRGPDCCQVLSRFLGILYWLDQNCMIASNNKIRGKDLFILSRLEAGDRIRSYAQYNQSLHKAPFDKELNRA